MASSSSGLGSTTPGLLSALRREAKTRSLVAAAARSASSPWAASSKREASDLPLASLVTSFQPDEAGEWRIHVTYDNEDIDHSPFKCMVFNPRAIFVSYKRIYYTV